MARLCYATEDQLAELMRQSGLPNRTPPTNAFRMLAHSPMVGAATLRLIFALLTETVLDQKLRELVILRIAERCDCQYAWTQHVAIARGVGIGEAEIAALENGETPVSLFNQRESAAFDLADKVLTTCRATDATLAALLKLFPAREVMELLLLIGYFRMVCSVMTTLGVDGEAPFGTQILDALREQARKRRTFGDRIDD